MPTAVIAGRVELDLLRGEMGSAVARRVVGAVFAHAGLGLDRLSDAAILAEALGARSPGGERLRMALMAERGSVDMEVGPFPDGQLELLRESLQVPGIGSVIDRLPDEVSTRRADEGTYLVMNFADPGLRGQEAG